MAYEPRTMNVPDEARQAKIDARNSALGKPGARNIEFVDPQQSKAERNELEELTVILLSLIMTLITININILS